MASDEQIEAAIEAKGLTAPRITNADVHEQVVKADYYVFPGTTLTICALTLKNGYVVTGESACASPENFDEALGREIAFNNARNKIWALEGYRLRSKLAGL